VLTQELSLLPCLLSLSDNVIHSSMEEKRHTGQGESTAHAAPNVFCTFQKQSLITSLQQTKYSYPQKVDVFGKGITLPGCAVLNQAGAGPCQPQLYAVLWSSGIELYDSHNTSSEPADTLPLHSNIATISNASFLEPQHLTKVHAHSSLLYCACCFNLFFIVPTHALHYTLKH